MTDRDIGRLRDIITQRRNELVDFCRKLIQTPSLPGQEGSAASVIRQEMDRLGYDEMRVDDVGNVIGLLRGSGGGRSLMLNTHLDHVDVGDEAGWPFPPFEGHVSDGEIWGRGAVDIKGPTAAQIYGAAAIRAAGLVPEGDVYVAVAVQEEVGGLGSIELAHSARTDRAVVGEPSGNVLRRGHRGRIELIISIEGRSCHASIPEKGINPHYTLARFLEGLRSVQLAEDGFLGRESFAPTLIFTDQTSANVVPGEIRLHVDWRTVPQKGPEEIERELQWLLDASLQQGATGTVKVMEKHRTTYTGLERDIPSAFPSMVIEEGDPLVQESKAALEAAFGRPMPVRRWEFATDGGHLTAAGIPTVGFGPGDETLAHTNRERIGIADLTAGSLGYAALALRLTAR